ncbi:hypothetical protein RhiJN_23933 [Ceratobasidium sp. AG-Ba]|nr:hypothetical protein RhiJN_23933 [Ceratobasidium sp. AG-Ba]
MPSEYSRPQLENFTYGVPVDDYLRKNCPGHICRYPADKVVSAINTLAWDMPENWSDTILEAFILVVHYPEHLELLKTDISLGWLETMKAYTERFPVSAHYLINCTTHHLSSAQAFSRSFGVLMIQVYGLLCMVAFLDENDELETFIERSSRASFGEAGILPELTAATVTMADANIEEREIDFEEYAGMFGAVPDSDDEDENPPSFAGSVDFEFDDAKFLLDVIYKSRDSFLGAFSFAADVGLFLIISMIRLQLCYFARRVHLADEATSKLIDLLDITHRYF